eukprot:363276-Chlamydomonas_euryale.AAC.2
MSANPLRPSLKCVDGVGGTHRASHRSSAGWGRRPATARLAAAAQGRWQKKMGWHILVGYTNTWTETGSMHAQMRCSSTN